MTTAAAPSGRPRRQDVPQARPPGSRCHVLSPRTAVQGRSRPGEGCLPRWRGVTAVVRRPVHHPRLRTDCPAADRPRVEPGQAAHRDVRLLPAGQRDPAAQHRLGVGGDPVQQAVVDAGHRGHAGAAAPVEHRQQPEALGEQRAGALHLEVHQAGEVGAGRRDGAVEPGRAAELGEVLGGQVRTAVAGVLANVPEDVGQLQGEAEGVGVLGGALGVRCARHRAEHAQREPADGAGDTAAVDLQLVPGLVGLAAHVHQHAVDQLVETLQRQREARGRRRRARRPPGRCRPRRPGRP